MGMSDDLIKRLRDPSTSSEASTARHDAADRIEHLEKKLKLLEKTGGKSDERKATSI